MLVILLPFLSLSLPVSSLTPSLPPPPLSLSLPPPLAIIECGWHLTLQGEEGMESSLCPPLPNPDIAFELHSTV